MPAILRVPIAAIYVRLAANCRNSGSNKNCRKCRCTFDRDNAVIHYERASNSPTVASWLRYLTGFFPKENAMANRRFEMFEIRRIIQRLRDTLRGPLALRRFNLQVASLFHFLSDSIFAAPRIFIAARQSCNTIKANALACKPHQIHKTLLTRKTQKPTLRFFSFEEAISQAAMTVTPMAGH